MGAVASPAPPKNACRFTWKWKKDLANMEFSTFAGNIMRQDSSKVVVTRTGLEPMLPP